MIASVLQTTPSEHDDKIIATAMLLGGEFYSAEVTRSGNWMWLCRLAGPMSLPKKSGWFYSKADAAANWIRQQGYQLDANGEPYKP